MVHFIRFQIFILLFTSVLNAQNQNLSEGIFFDGEPHFEVNPFNDQHIVIAWMGFELFENIAINTRTSFDGGETWSVATYLNHVNDFHTSADPIVGFTSDGQPFICFIDLNPAGTTGAVYIVHSEDSGLTWNEPIEVINIDDDPGEFPLDRPWVVADVSDSPYQDYIYMCTKPAPWEPVPNKSYFIRSTDGGLSWDEWQNTDAPGFSVGPLIDGPMASLAVDKEGSLFIIYPAWDPSENLLPRFVLAKSTNGGVSFDYLSVLESSEGGISDTLPKVGYSLHSNPAVAGHLAFVYIFLNTSEADIDVFMIETFDDGENWTDPLRINDDEVGNGVMQDLTWAAFNDNGDFLVTWRDRNTTGLSGYEIPTEILGRVRKNGEDFGASFPLTTSPVNHDEILNGNGNDFMCNAFINDTIYAAWGDVSSGALNIWFSKKTLGGGTLIQNLETKELLLSPNPISSESKLNVPLNGIFNYEIYNQKGSVVMKGSGSSPLGINQLNPGKYYIIINQDNDRFTNSIIIQ